MLIAHDFEKRALQWQEQVLTLLIKSYSMLAALDFYQQFV